MKSLLITRHLAIQISQDLILTGLTHVGIKNRVSASISLEYIYDFSQKPVFLAINPVHSFINRTKANCHTLIHL